MALTAIARLQLDLPGYRDVTAIVFEDGPRAVKILSVAELEGHLWNGARGVHASVKPMGLVRLSIDPDAPMGIRGRSDQGGVVDDWFSRLPTLGLSFGLAMYPGPTASFENSHAR